MNNYQIKQQFKQKAIRFYLVNTMMAVIIAAAIITAIMVLTK